MHFFSSALQYTADDELFLFSVTKEDAWKIKVAAVTSFWITLMAIRGYLYWRGFMIAGSLSESFCFK